MTSTQEPEPLPATLKAWMKDWWLEPVQNRGMLAILTIGFVILMLVPQGHGNRERQIADNLCELLNYDEAIEWRFDNKNLALTSWQDVWHVTCAWHEQNRTGNVTLIGANVKVELDNGTVLNG